MPYLTKSIAVSLSFAVLWTVAALVSPTTTFHLAPLIVAAAPLLPAEGTPAIRLAPASLAIAVATALALAMADLLRGPSLLPWGGALAESVTFAAAGSVVALVGSLGTARSAAT